MEIDNIYNCDCLEGMKQIPDGTIDAVVTSPPYDNLRKYGGTAAASGEEDITEGGDNQGGNQGNNPPSGELEG